MAVDYSQDNSQDRSQAHHSHFRQIAALEDKLNEMQTTLCYQDDTIETLNNMVSKQHQEIEQLHQKIRILSQAFKDMKSDLASGVKPLNEEVPPPHY